jgi:hypothetical protein
LVQHFGRNIEGDDTQAGLGKRDRLKSGPAAQLEHLLPGPKEVSEMSNSDSPEMEVERVPLDHAIILWCRRIE